MQLLLTLINSNNATWENISTNACSWHHDTNRFQKQTSCEQPRHVYATELRFCFKCIMPKTNEIKFVNRLQSSAFSCEGLCALSRAWDMSEKSQAAFRGDACLRMLHMLVWSVGVCLAHQYMFQCSNVPNSVHPTVRFMHKALLPDTVCRAHHVHHCHYMRRKKSWHDASGVKRHMYADTDKHVQCSLSLPRHPEYPFKIVVGDLHA